MLKSHSNLLQPRPSDRVRIGDCVVDIPLREIAPAEGGEPVRITLKALGVLLALVAHAGKPVSREALFEWVWPDTLPTDDVLTQAVTQLRKAFGDDRERPRYIETIAKQGYRLVAPVAWVLDEASEDPLAEAQPVGAAATQSRSGRQARLVTGAVALAALVAGGAWWSQRSEPAVTAPPLAIAAPATSRVMASFVRIASLPQSEEWPSLSPDGALVVYSRAAADGASLVLQTASATAPRALTTPRAGQKDLMPAWSPDGQRIAFSRVVDGHCRIMLVPASGGPAQELGECLADDAHPVSWYPDGRALVGAQRPGGASKSVERALHRMALDEGRWRRIEYVRSPSDEDMSPVVSPDGRWIAFHRNLSIADVWRMPAEGGMPERLTDLRTNLYGLAWARDSRHLVFARYREGRIYLNRLDTVSGRIVEAVAGNDNMMYPAMARTGDAIAFEVESTQSRMRRVALGDGEGAMAGSRRLFDSSGSNLMPAIAPDGHQILFYSSRTGDQRLWWLDQRDPDSLRSFEGFVPVPRYPAMWNPRSGTALVIGTQRGEPYGIYEIDPARGRVTRLPVPDRQPVHVSWHPDPNRLLVVADRGEGRLGLTLYDRSLSPWRSLARLSDVASTVVDAPRGRIVMSTPASPEIRSADLALGDVRPVDAVGLPRRARSMVATADGVRVLDSDPDCRWRWRPVGGEGAPAVCLGGEEWFLEGVTLDPASDALYVSVVEDMQGDIGMLPLSAFDAPPVDGGAVVGASH
ncbi:MAG: PD40 domain-containing protein [Xanthomonadaceae bacterium]|nr:PD40 domain-containing protein [Xanthomonadaceae bacterium]